MDPLRSFAINVILTIWSVANIVSRAVFKRDSLHVGCEVFNAISLANCPTSTTALVGPLASLQVILCFNTEGFRAFARAIVGGQPGNAS